MRASPAGGRAVLAEVLMGLMDPGVPQGEGLKQREAAGCSREQRGDPGLHLPSLQVRQGEEEEQNRPPLSAPRGPEPQA